MASKDQYNNVKVVRMISPGEYNTEGQPAAQNLDTKGYESVTLVFFAGDITTAQTLTLKHSLDDSAYEDVEAADVIADPDNSASEILTAFKATGTDNDVIKCLGYKGNRRYLQVDSTTADSGAIFSVFAILGNPKNAPVDRS